MNNTFEHEGKLRIYYLLSFFGCFRISCKHKRSLLTKQIAFKGIKDLKQSEGTKERGG